MRIVLGVDGSKYSEWAIGWLAKTPFRTAPKATAVHAVDLHALRAPFVVQPVIVGTERYIQEEIKRLLKRAKLVSSETKDRLAALDVPGTVRIEKGPVAPMILKHARRGGLVVVGNRGLDAVDRFMLGSISTYVTLHSPCSVLVVREPARALRRILVATDGSPSSRKALEFLTKQFQLTSEADPIDILLVHVMPFLRYPEIKEAGKALLEHDAARLEKAGYRVRTIPRLGRPAEEILKVARREKPDLIVTGAKGLGAVGRFLLGSVSTKVVQHSTHSVLVVR
jgi:nucleotide-binding universal stress UspA family protein